MSKHATNIIRKQIFIDIKIYQAISSMAQPAFTKILVLRKKRRMVQFVQQSNDLAVIQSFASDTATNFMNTNPSALKQATLIIREILVQHIHAGRDSPKYSAA